MGIRAASLSGNVVNDGEFKVSGSDTQAAYAPVHPGDQGQGLDLRPERLQRRVDGEAAQGSRRPGRHSVKVWACSLACYTPAFLQQGGKDVEGTYLWLPFVPLEEADTVPALQQYIDGVGGLDKTTVVGRRLLDRRAALRAGRQRHRRQGRPERHHQGQDPRGAEGRQGRWLVQRQGIYGDKLNLSGPFTCYVMMQVQDGKFVRVSPTREGQARLPLRRDLPGQPRPDEGVQGLSRPREMGRSRAFSPAPTRRRRAFEPFISRMLRIFMGLAPRAVGARGDLVSPTYPGRRMQRFRWLSAVLVLATVVAACGRSDDGANSTATTAANDTATTAVAPPATGGDTATRRPPPTSAAPRRSPRATSVSTTRTSPSR